MAILETASAYVLGILMNNEEVKKFPKEFIDESVKWVKSWFLTPEDPTSTKILSNPDKPESSKKIIVESKLEDLQNNATFMKELEAKLQVYSTHKARIKNVFTNAEVKVKSDIHIGDKTASPNDDFVEKNVIKGGKFESTDGGFHLGDD